MTEKKIEPHFWEKEIYSKGRNIMRYPYDSVVSFVFRNRPANKSPANTKILEVGCGTGNNLWFAAREGFRVFGIDISKSAIDYAKKRFQDEHLKGVFKVCGFSKLPFKDSLFDLAIDRGALVCCGRSEAAKAVKELHRVLKKGGRFFSNMYSKEHTSSKSGLRSEDGLVEEITDGSVSGVGALCFYNKADIVRLFKAGWKIISIEHMIRTEKVTHKSSVHAEWYVIAEKI